MVCIFVSYISSNTIGITCTSGMRRRLLPRRCKWRCSCSSLRTKLVRRLTTLGSNPKPLTTIAVHNVDEDYDLQHSAYLPVKKRMVMGLMTVLFCAHNFYVPVKIAGAATSKRVRLKDVQNPMLQDALRAAVSGSLEDSERIFSDLIAQEPENASVWSNRGSVRVSLNKFEAAVEDLSEAIKLAPQAPVPFLNRAIAYEALGRYQDAIEDCKSAIVNDPEEFAAWYNLGNVDVKVQDYDGALVAYERASTLAPGIAGYRLKQALILFQLNRPEEARKLVEGLVRKYPNYSEARAALAAILWSENRRSGAEEQFTQATIQEPLYRNIGWLNAELQWPPNIVHAMENFLSIE
ncbi:uncharacterized protein LOC131055019 [Cryptomeria japonica]|uniref:uncharacterized protein LOC131055019 n=1 Tax=Cryptomeria japonica TaxID=3369 RepID=UPI0027D9D565|nr:uncharacterized protein LOC131055019 [Cryptomeria japonica]